MMASEWVLMEKTWSHSNRLTEELLRPTERQKGRTAKSRTAENYCSLFYEHCCKKKKYTPACRTHTHTPSPLVIVFGICTTKKNNRCLGVSNKLKCAKMYV